MLTLEMTCGTIKTGKYLIYYQKGILQALYLRTSKAYMEMYYGYANMSPSIRWVTSAL